jgi:D-alanine-D-alanine ligase
MTQPGLKRTPGFGKIGVLAGGVSNEREISLRSGRAVYDALVTKGLEAVLLDVRDDIAQIIKAHKLAVAFIALHGRFGEDGTVQTILEKADIPYTGSGAEASRRALDKIASKRIFTQNRIPTPRYMIAEKGNPVKEIAKTLGFPVVVKPQFEGSSIGLSVVREEDFLEEAFRIAFGYGDKAIAEEYIEGREITVGILGDMPLPVVEIITANNVYDYNAKYNDPGTRYIVPAAMEKNIYERAQKLGAASHRALGCSSFSRVDMIVDKKGDIYVLEVNTIPGMTERSLLPKAAQAFGLSFGELCVKLIEIALQKPK